MSAPEEKPESAPAKPLKPRHPVTFLPDETVPLVPVEYPDAKRPFFAPPVKPAPDDSDPA